MTDLATAQEWIANALRDAGLLGRGSIWRSKGTEVQWVVQIDRLPYGERLGVDIGLDLQTQSTPRRPTNCPILLHLETLPVTRDLPITEALELDSSLDETSRRQAIDAAAVALGHYLSKHQTLAEVRGAYRSGDFTAAAIRKDVRAVLESAAAP